MNSRQRTYTIVSQIPKGKVLTYKTLANLSNVTNPRLSGMYLHQNPYKNIPCYRVINSKGQVAKTYAFGGGDEQLKKLKKDGIKPNKNNLINLDKYLWKPTQDELFYLYFLMKKSFSQFEIEFLK